MLTMNYLFEKNYPIDHVLTEFDKATLRLENLNSNYSYVCLMNEMLAYKGTTVNDLFKGWSGVKLFDTKPTEVKF
jgi:hypothetical protein